MLRRSLSDPIGLNQGYPLDIAANQNDLRVSSLNAEKQKPLFYGHPTSGLRKEWRLLRQHRCVDERDDCEGRKQIVGQADDLHAAEEDEIWNSSAIHPEQKRVIVELLQCKKRLMGMNANLQRALNASEDSNAELEIQNTDLKSQIKSLNISVKAMEKFKAEMDEIQAALAESQMANNSLKSQINKMQKENKAMSTLIEANASEMSDVLFESKTNKKKIADLNQHIKALEKQLEESRVQLEEKCQIIIKKDFMIDQQKNSLREMTDIGQNLRGKIKDLENQLELALITGRGSFLRQDGTFSVAADNNLSLAEELGQLSAFRTSASSPIYQVEFNDVEVNEGVEFAADIMDSSKALADELKEALEEDKLNENKEVISNNEEIITLCREMEDAGKLEQVEVEVEDVEKVEEVAVETVVMDPNREDAISHELAETLEDEVMEQIARPGDIKEPIKLELEKTEVKDDADMGAEWPCKAQISFLEEEKKSHENSVCVEQTNRSLPRAALVAGAVGLGLLIFLKIKA